MNLQELRQRPILIHILTLVCLLFTLNLVLITVNKIVRAEDDAGLMLYLRYFIPLVLWLATCAGFIGLKSWAWGLFLGFLFFSVLNFMNMLISGRMEIHPPSILFIVINLALIGLLNLATVRNAFKVGRVKHKHFHASLVNFAVFFIFGGFFLFLELFSHQRIASSVFAAKFFVSALGLIWMVLGFGIWQARKIALQSVQPILIFTVISVTFICGKDFLSEASFLSGWQSLVYVLVSIGIFGWWNIFIKVKNI